MNGLGQALCSLSETATLVALTALIMERVASRRGPSAASWVASASLVVIIVLTPLAFCPRPSFMSWRSPVLWARPDFAELERSSVLVERGPTTGSTVAASASADTVGRTRSSWQSLSRRLGIGLAWGTASPGQRPVVVPTAVCVMVLAGTACCLIRLLLGLCGVRDCRRKSIAIVDPDLLALADSLRIALGVARPIEVREFSGLSTAAAVGWRRPLVLLPPEWRSWSDSELRAVLAHEVAHIARADYAAGVAARLGLALHFYHPLVHWMAARLQLQQELAADAEAARLAGGSRVYLRALSRLALNTHKNRPAWPASAFLPRNGHLIRRIHMLKDQLRVQNRPITMMGRVCSVAVLVTVAVVAVEPQSPSRAESAEKPPATSENPSDARAASREAAFDLAYIPRNAMGFVAVRPATIFDRADMKTSLAVLNAIVSKSIPIAVPRFESIEQASVGLYVYPRDRKAGRPGRFTFSGGMVRSVHDFDWKSLVRAGAKLFGGPKTEIVEVRFEGTVYYKATNLPDLVSNDCFYFPDARTVVNLGEEEIRRLATQKKTDDLPEFVRGSEWKTFERGLIALAIDNHDQRWRLDVANPEPEDLVVAPLIQNATRWVCGVDGADSLFVRAIATCATDNQGQSLARTAESLLCNFREAFRNTKIDDSKGENDLEAKGLRLARELLDGCKLRREGKIIEVSAECHLALEFLVKMILADAGM